MMEKKIYRQLTNDARKALAEWRLHDVFIISNSLIKDCSDADLLREFESIERDYHAMLDFIATGGEDPNRDAIHLQLRQRASSLLTELERITYLLPYPGRMVDDLYEDNSFPARQLEQAFYDGLVQEARQEEVREILTKRLTDSRMEEADMLFTGMALSVSSVFDIEKISLLLEHATSEPRALLGIILSVLRFERELRVYPDTYRAIRRLMEDKSIQDMIVHINHELFLCSQSERIEHHIKEELIPSMMDAVQDERLRLDFTLDEDGEKDSFEQLMSQQNAHPLSPEQEKKKKQFMASMHEFVNMQQEGIDINSEIMDICGKLPFFKEMANWFMPFNPHHPCIEPAAYPGGRPNFLLRMMYDMTYMCDMDKYAMTLILSKKLTNSKLQHAMKEVHEKLAESVAIPNADFNLPVLNEKQTISNLIRAMYRFFYKSAWKEELPNPFELELNFSSNHLFGHIFLENQHYALEMGDTMWKLGCQSDALPYYQAADSIETGLTEKYYLRIASIYDEKGDENSTLRYLQYAEKQAPQDSKVLYAIASFYKKKRKPDMQYKYLARLEELYPENAKVLTEMGNYLIEQERYQEASQRFYKMEYIEKRLLTAQRGIAWCAMHQEKYDTAMRYYRKIFNTPGAATWNDYLNGGHTAWLMNDMTSALTFYHQYIKRYLTDDPEITDALEPFNKDIPMLRDLGKSAIDVALMHDMIALKAI